MLPPVNPADRGAVSQKTGLPPRGRCGPEAGHPPQLAEADPVGRSRQARTKILDTLVEIPGDTASDAGSTPAASTNSCIWRKAGDPQTHRVMGQQDSLEVRVLRTIEELLKDRPAGARSVDVNMVLERMRLKPEDRDDLASCMRDLWQKGHVDAPTPLTGDNKVMDVDVTAITEQGLRRLEK